jgi:hypothetical protein
MGLGARRRRLGGRKCREAGFAPEKRQLAGVRRQMVLPLPRRGSPVHTLIEFVLWLWLGEEIAGTALFIKEEGSGVILLP